MDNFITSRCHLSYLCLRSLKSRLTYFFLESNLFSISMISWIERLPNTSFVEFWWRPLMLWVRAQIHSMWITAMPLTKVNNTNLKALSNFGVRDHQWNLTMHGTEFKCFRLKSRYHPNYQHIYKVWNTG